MTAHVTTPAAALADELPEWVTLVRAPNPGPMTLDGTNTWVLRAIAGAPAVVIDPGPLDEGHLATIAAHGPIGAVLATHGHPDHVEGLDRFAELSGAPVLRDLTERDLDDIHIRQLPTPGHTADSVCFVAGVGARRAVFPAARSSGA